MKLIFSSLEEELDSERNRTRMRKFLNPSGRNQKCGDSIILFKMDDKSKMQL